MRNVICLFWLAIVLLSCQKDEQFISYPVLGEDPLVDIIVVLEEGKDVFGHWVERDIEGATVVHVSSRDALAVIPPEAMEELKAVIKGRFRDDKGSNRETVVDESNFLFAAAQLGIVHELYWILPHKFFDDIPLAGKKIKDFLMEKGHLDETDIRSLRMLGGCVTGILSGVKIYICGPRTLPEIMDPILITIDVSFFPTFAEEHRQSNLRAMKWFIDDLTFKHQLHVRDVSVSYNVRNGFTEVLHRYLGDQLIEGLGNPEIFKAESPPELWQFRDKAENMFSGGEGKLVEEYLVDPLSKYPDDPALRLLNAATMVRLGKYGEALEVAEELCHGDRNYCDGLTYLASAISEPDVRTWREKFLSRAREALPGIQTGKEAVTGEIAH